MHRLALHFRQALDDAPRDELGRRHDYGLGRNRLQLATQRVSDLHSFFFGHHGHSRRACLHPVFALRLENVR